MASPTLDELEKAARADKLSNLPGMGEKSQAHILAGIEAIKQQKQRLSIHKALAIAEKWLDKLKGIRGIEKTGSSRQFTPLETNHRRPGLRWCNRKTSRGDASLPGIWTASTQVLSQGDHKTSVVTEDGLNLQLWLQPPERFGSLLQFVTGSKEHNVRLREYALKQGLSLSERGFVDQDLKETLMSQEEDVYQKLGIALISRLKLREDRGEIRRSSRKAIAQPGQP